MDDATRSQTRNLEEKTGKTLDQWVKLVKAQKLEKHGEMVSFLKSAHALGHGYANLVVLSARQAIGEGAPAADDLVAAQYAGAKAALRPLYEAIVTKVAKFGADVELAPKKGYVSLRRKKQFGLLQPSTATRLDIGINLKGLVTPGSAQERLEASGSWNAMVSHRVRVESAKDIDAELLGWLKKAYDEAG